MDNNKLVKWLENEKIKDSLKTESNKRQFINEIRSGLGEQIIKEGNAKPEKIGFFTRLKRRIKLLLSAV